MIAPEIIIATDEATAAKRRVYFELYDWSQLPLNADGLQPYISVNGASLTATGIGTLTRISGAALHYADLTQAVCVDGDVIEVAFGDDDTCPRQYGTAARIAAAETATAYTLTLDEVTVPLNGAHVVTATVTPNGPFTGQITVTGSGVACSAPVVLTFTDSAVAQTAEITPSATGTLTVTGTNNADLTDPAAATCSVTAGPPQFDHAEIGADRTYIRVFLDQEIFYGGSIAGKFTLTLNGEANSIVSNSEPNGERFIDLYGDSNYTPGDTATVTRTQGSNTQDLVNVGNETVADFTEQTAVWPSSSASILFPFGFGFRF